MRLACRALLFDLDGVLVDSTRAVELVWRAWAERNGVAWELLRARMHGRRTVDLVAELAPSLDAAAEGAAIDGRQVQLAAQLDRPLSGAIELLRGVPRGRWAVVTSGPRPLAEARLRAAAIPPPGALVTGDDVASGKPDPGPYLLGAERLAVVPSDCVGVEDAPAGVASVSAAGMRAVGVTTTHAAEQLAMADAVVAGLHELSVASDGDGLVVTLPVCGVVGGAP